MLSVTKSHKTGKTKSHKTKMADQPLARVHQAVRAYHRLRVGKRVNAEAGSIWRAIAASSSRCSAARLPLHGPSRRADKSRTCRWAQEPGGKSAITRDYTCASSIFFDCASRGGEA